jgi:hypothetical protein
MDCERTRSHLLLALYGEVSDAERTDSAAHIAACAACRTAEADERRLHAILAERADASLEPDDEFLARCRRDLAVALDREPAPRVRFGLRLGAFWMESRLSPAFGVALAAAGFLVGVVALRLLPGLGMTPAGPAPMGAAAVSPPVANVLSLESADDSDQVRLSYDTSQRAQMEGSVADPQIRALLVATVRDSLNAGFRLEAIGALSQHTGHAEVRAALLDAMRRDSNPGARLRALDALSGRIDSDAAVRRALFETVRGDSNPGMRVRAIDFLARGRDRDLLPEMERLASEDPDAYVRMRSAGYVDAVAAGDRR